MEAGEQQAFFHSEAECQDYATQKIGLASMQFECVEFPVSLPKGAPF